MNDLDLAGCSGFLWSQCCIFSFHNGISGHVAFLYSAG